MLQQTASLTYWRDFICTHLDVNSTIEYKLGLGHLSIKWSYLDDHNTNDTNSEPFKFLSLV